MKERGIRKKLIGVVVSNSTDKTAVVQVSRLKKHRTYKKYITRQKKYKAHDPQNSCQVGDKVRIIESRPISKTKRWQVIDIIDKSREEALGAGANAPAESQS
jgi:small subunit ribosomal protein S17